MAPQPNRKICIVTGSRADFGHLCWLMQEIENDPALDLQIIATGTHLDKSFGETYKEIEQHGFTIDTCVPLDQANDTRPEITKAMGRGMIGFADAFEALKPDIVAVLGDRFEIFVAASAALMADIPIAHIHGGEVTEGALDDSLRHAITKMAHVHFAVAEAYGNRIIQMGESAERVFITGVPGLDNIDRLNLPDLSEIEKELGISLGDSFFLITYHPETIGVSNAKQAANELISALKQFPNHTKLITGVNADPDHQSVKECFEQYAAENPRRTYLKESLGTRLYLAAMKQCDCVIGNSSSGIIEAPALNVPTINIGSRQKGRLRATSIIDCDAKDRSIQNAINQALSPDFQKTLTNATPPYGRSGASVSIKDHLKAINLDHLQIKQFNDFNLEQTLSHGH